MTDHLGSLRKLSLFAGLDEAGLSSVASVATEVEVHSGHVFVERGHPAAGCFVILAGDVVVDLPSGESIERGPGDFFGELSVLTDATRTARVHATTDVRCLAIARDDLMRIVESEPTIAVAMLKTLAARLAAVT